MGAPAAAALAGNSFVILSVSVVGILAISLLLLAYYLFLTKCGLASWRRAADRDIAAATRFHGTITIYSPAPARRGLEDAAIRRIPTFRYRNKPLQAELAAASECAVCLGEFRDGERLRLLPPCLHAFHIDCIDAWLHATANCPLCRAAVSGSGYAPHVHVDIVTVLQADATAAVSNADDVVIDIPSPSPADIGRGGIGEVGGSSGRGSGGGKMSMRDDQCIGTRRDDGGDLLSGVQQPMRRSMSMDSCNDRQFYLALQKALRQHHSAVLLREDGKAGESSAAAVAGGSRAGGRLRRSFFSFSQSRSSRSAVLPI